MKTNDTPWIVIDVHNLCYRAWFASAHPARGRGSRMLLGFFQSIQLLRKQVACDDFVFCFESPKLVRKEQFPGYKAPREKTEQEQAEQILFHRKVDALRTEHLPQMGFMNVLQLKGMEADDIMARIAEECKFAKQQAILVSSDADLYQCLSPFVCLYSPHTKKIVTSKGFEKEYGIRPSRWSLVKALAGCSGDKVPGVGGVGEVTALKYLRGELPLESKVMKTIQSDAGRRAMLFNLGLVKLPHPDCPPVLARLWECPWPTRAWERVLRQITQDERKGK